MRTLLLGLSLLLFPTLAVAQKPDKPAKVKPAKTVTSPLPKGAHSDITFELAEVMPADSLIEADVIYTAKSAVIEVTRSADGTAHILDADATDGVASVETPDGAQVWASATGKPKSTANLQGQEFTRAKGKSEWKDITAGLSGVTSWTWVSTGAGLKLRFYTSEAPADSAAVE